ncbi:MAG: glycosyltransferase [Candidatus Bathyarchaeia archaeon]
MCEEGAGVLKISILCPDLSNNCLGRAYLLGRVLQRRHEVEIVGPIFGNRIWDPVANLGDMKFRTAEIGGIPRAYWQVLQLAKIFDGDAIYASKPLFTSYGIGLLKRISESKPLILDIDDWQLGFIREGYSNMSFGRYLESLAISAIWFHKMSSYWTTLIGEEISHLADEITVSNTFLRDKFGGTIVWHGRDTEAFNPEKFDNDSIRERYEVDREKKMVMFFGTPAPYKGIEDLIQAIRLIRDREVALVVVGINHRDSYCRELALKAGQMLGENFTGISTQPYDRVPEILAMADVVAIPQRRNFATIGQIPAKLFDAMSMAKPIVSTNVCDIGDILNGCGWTVEPGRPEQLAEAIRDILDNPQKAEDMGRRARKKCIDEYSYDAIEKVLMRIFSKYE